MKKLLAIYFSGTGNTTFAVNKFCAQVSASGVICEIASIENFNKSNLVSFNADTILVAYPIYGSDMPRIMEEFILNNSEVFSTQSLITLVTQQVFSGDGGALAARIIKHKYLRKSSIHIKQMCKSLPSKGN